MGFFSRKSKASREEVDKAPRASTDERSMNRSSSAKQMRGRPTAVTAGSGHSASAPSSPKRGYFSHARNTSKDRNASQEVFYTTDPEAPPVPQPPQFKFTALPVPPKNPRRSSDYFSSRTNPGQSNEGYSAPQRKTLELSHSPPKYADSGYESNGSRTALHSRAPSELNYQEESRQGSESEYLPELKLGGDSLSQSIIAAETKPPPKRNESYFQRQTIEDHDGNVSPIDLEFDSKPVKPHRSSLSISKRTRFEDTPEMPTLDQLQSFHCAPMTNPSRVAPGSYGASQIAATAGATAIREGFSLDLPAHESEFQTKYMDISAPLEQVTSTSSIGRSTQPFPPLSILEGFKVNKKGRILDEEGDQIGELVEGDLLDCVRQKANARGEVIDGYGRVVGIVRTIRQGAELQSPSTDTTSPTHDVQIAQSAQPFRVEPIRSVLAIRTHSTPSLPIETHRPEPAYQKPEAEYQTLEPVHQKPESVYQKSETVYQKLAKIPSPIAESPRVPEPEAPVERQPEVPVIVTQDETALERTQAYVRSQGSQSQEELPLQLKSAMKDPEQRRPMIRSESERSLSDLSKPWARPNMSSVPENDVPEDAVVPDSPGLYAFKGEVPADDRPQREARSRSPNVAINAKAALALGQPNSAPFASGPFAHGGRMGPRRATTHFAGSYSNGTLSIAPANKPYKPSPLSSHETSPKRSDASDSVSDDGRVPHTRATSVAASVYSVATSTSKPRTYFTHAGKVTVNPDDVPAQKPEEKPVAAAPKEKTKEEKKKSRLSIGFHRKTVAK